MASDASDILSVLKENFAALSEAGAFDPLLDDFMANEVIPEWQSRAPVDTGEYKESIGVTEPANGGKGQVGATDEAASFVEFGTEKTPEYAPMRATAEYFNSGQARQ